MSEVSVSQSTDKTTKVSVFYDQKKYNITLYKNGNNPNIYYYFRWNGKSYQGSSGTDDLEKSKTIVPEIFYDITKGIRKKGHRRVTNFKEVVKEFIKHKERQNLSPNTLVDYRLKSKFLMEKFGNEDISYLCSKKKGLFLEYQEWRENYYQKHKEKRLQTYTRGKTVIKGRHFDTVGIVSLNRECRLLVSILRFSQEYLGLLPGIEIPRYKHIPETGRKNIFSYGEYRRLEKYWKEKNPYYWSIISFVDKTGIRYPSELNRILWRDVNFQEGYVLIRNRKSRGNTIDTEIPLTEKTRAILEYLHSREGISKKSDDYVFVNDKGVQVKNIVKGFKKSLSELGITKKVSMYTFRHTFTTRMVNNPDIPLKTLSYILGHKDTTMLDTRYSHITGKQVRRIFQSMEEKKKKKL